jgi:hypothetical protein
MSTKKYVVTFYEPENLLKGFRWHPPGEPEELSKEEAIKRFDFVRSIAKSGKKLEDQWLVGRVAIKTANGKKMKLVCYAKNPPKGPWQSTYKALRKKEKRAKPAHPMINVFVRQSATVN